jgi:hypothetical protein
MLQTTLGHPTEVRIHHGTFSFNEIETHTTQVPKYGVVEPEYTDSTMNLLNFRSETVFRGRIHLGTSSLSIWKCARFGPLSPFKTQFQWSFSEPTINEALPVNITDQKKRFPVQDSCFFFWAARQSSCRRQSHSINDYVASSLRL